MFPRRLEPRDSKGLVHLPSSEKGTFLHGALGQASRGGDVESSPFKAIAGASGNPHTEATTRERFPHQRPDRPSRAGGASSWTEALPIQTPYFLCGFSSAGPIGPVTLRGHLEDDMCHLQHR